MICSFPVTPSSLGAFRNMTLTHGLQRHFKPIALGPTRVSGTDPLFLLQEAEARGLAFRV